MRQIQIIDRIRVRFPGRNAEFDEGVEVGLIAALMGQREPEITRCISNSALTQLRPLAERLGYRVWAEPEGDNQRVTLETVKVKPRLRVIASN